MTQVIILILVGAALMVVGLRIVRSKRADARPAARIANRTKTYHCVEVRCDDSACAAVRRLEGIRFLSDQAPLLPVSGCSAQKCTCQYVHYDDRRDDDRRNPFGQWANLPPTLTGERRSRNDRRGADSQTPDRPTITR
jgi:hypothetical protein